jgi:hypothetical protein
MRFYQAPTHIKAQGGVLLVDDFGRQKIPPAELLNRWIMPLERGRDQLLLRTGEMVEIPFHVTLLFSTNLNPDDLADSAYLRRIPYKVHIPACGPQQFVEILGRACESLGVACNKDSLAQASAFVSSVRDGNLSGALARDLAAIISENSRQDDLVPALSLPGVEFAYQQFTGVYYPDQQRSATPYPEEDAVPDDRFFA